MIQVQVYRNQKQEITGYQVSGHANAGQYGLDIVCSAVSVLAQTTLLGLHELAGIQVQYTVEPGFLSCKLPPVLSDEQRQQAELLLKTMVLGIQNLTVGYSEYIMLHDKEV